MATHTIGTGGDYSSIRTWVEALPVTPTEPMVGRLLHEVHAITATLPFGGIATSAANTITLECAPGASFRDHAGAATNPLRPDASHGAIITSATASLLAIGVGVSHVILRGLQVDLSGADSRILHAYGTNNVTVEGCVFRSSDAGTTGYQVLVHGNAAVMRNCLLIVGGATAGVKAIQAWNGAMVDACTIVRPASSPDSGIGVSTYGAANLRGCALFGFGVAAADSYTTGSDYNATDLASIGTGQGTHNLQDVLYANAFVDPEDDFRLKAGSPLIGASAAIAGVTADVVGRPRPEGAAPDIGAWEYAATGPSPAATLALAGPSGGAVSAASTNFTATPDGVFTGTATPATDGAGTFAPPSLTWAGTSDAKTFTYTPSTESGSPHDVSISSSPALAYTGSPIAYAVSPPARTFAEALDTYAINRISEVERGDGGPAKFAELLDFPSPLVGAEMHNHYDPIYVYWRSTKDDPDPLYDEALRVALYQYRDIWVRPAGGGIQGFHVNSLGLREHWEDTLDPLSLDGVLSLNQSAYVLDGYPVDDPTEGPIAQWMLSREVAYALCAMIDAERAGVAHRVRCDDLARTAMSHLTQWIDPAFTATWWEDACLAQQPFMMGLTMRALIAYWDRYRDAVVTGIPAKVKQAIDWLMANAYHAPTQTFPYWVQSTAPMQANAACNAGRYIWGYYDGPTNPIPNPALNLMSAPAFAWYAIYSGDATYRARFEDLFIGAQSPGGVDGTLRPYHEKEHHQGYLWGPRGIDWRDRSLTPPTEATSYTLARVGSGDVRANHLAVLLAVELPVGTGRATPVTITPVFGTGRGRSVPPSQVLTTDEPRAVFRVALDPLDDGATVMLSTANDGGLTDPPAIAVDADGVAPFATSIAYDLPLDPPGSTEYGSILARLVPAGAVPPASADARGGAIRIQSGDGYAGGDFTPANFFLTGDFPEVRTSYRPAESVARSPRFFNDMGWAETYTSYTAGSAVGTAYRATAGAPSGPGVPIVIAIEQVANTVDGGGLEVSLVASDGGAISEPSVRFYGVRRYVEVEYTPIGPGTKTITMTSLATDPAPLVVEVAGGPAATSCLMLSVPGGVLNLGRGGG